jgi:hypothetical protein
MRTIWHGAITKAFCAAFGLRRFGGFGCSGGAHSLRTEAFNGLLTSIKSKV